MICLALGNSYLPLTDGALRVSTEENARSNLDQNDGRSSPQGGTVDV